MGGVCTSCESTSVATAKLIMQDGKLQEFPYAVKVSQVLQNQSCFICNSDDLEFDMFTKAMKKDEVLYPGKLYFALPLSSLTYPLHAEKMAELAVKASLALVKSGGGGRITCCFKGSNSNRLVYTEKEINRPMLETSSSYTSLLVKPVQRRSKGAGGGRASYKPELMAIAE